MTRGSKGGGFHLERRKAIVFHRKYNSSFSPLHDHWKNSGLKPRFVALFVFSKIHSFILSFFFIWVAHKSCLQALSNLRYNNEDLKDVN